MISRKYLYLIALAKEKHFGRAAAVCNISASTLSAAIRELEREVGVAVVERGKTFTSLTPEGRCVLEYARRMAASANDLKQALAKSRSGLTGRLRLAVIPTALTVVASLTSAFSRRYPMVTIEVLSLSTPEILTRLRSFAVDGAIAYLESANAEDLATQPLWKETHVLITAASSALDGRESITWRQAAEIPLCLLTPDMQNRKTINSVFTGLGCRPQPTMETNSIISMLAHVCAGSWSSIVPRSVLDLIGTPEGMRVLELTEPSVVWATGLITLAREPGSPMVEALTDEARALAGIFDKFE